MQMGNVFFYLQVSFKKIDIVAPFPKNYLNSSIALNQTITVGEIMESMNGITHKKDNWHDNFKSVGDLRGNCSRINIIKFAIRKILYEMHESK